MWKPKLIFYSQELSSCPCYNKIFGIGFETYATKTEPEFQQRVRDAEADAAVVCFCSAQERYVEILSRLHTLAGPLPVLACCKSFNPGFIHLAAKRGVTHFLLCDMEVRKIREFVFWVFRGSGLRGFLESYSRTGVGSSPHVAKLIPEIVHVFPHRSSVQDLSQRLGITARRLQAVCQEAFGRSFTQLMRLIRIHQALTLMRNTSLDNTEIALELNYSEGGSLSRIFRKELGYSPSEARRRLSRRTPEELLREFQPKA